jgi:hypothetical protein
VLYWVVKRFKSFIWTSVKTNVSFYSQNTVFHILKSILDFSWFSVAPMPLYMYLFLVRLVVLSCIDCIFHVHKQFLDNAIEYDFYITIECRPIDCFNPFAITFTSCVLKSVIISLKSDKNAGPVSTEMFSFEIFLVLL